MFSFILGVHRAAADPGIPGKVLEFYKIILVFFRTTDFMVYFEYLMYVDIHQYIILFFRLTLNYVNNLFLVIVSLSLSQISFQVAQSGYLRRGTCTPKSKFWCTGVDLQIQMAFGVAWRRMCYLENILAYASKNIE